MSGFKSGEWHLLAGRGIARVATGPGSLVVATVHENDGWDKYEVAKQIAKQHNAHAELVAALKEMVEQYGGLVDGGVEEPAALTVDHAKAALAKASPVIATIYDELDTMPENPPDA